MTDKGDGRAGPRTGRERIQKLAQAALNADMTVEQLDDVLAGLGESLIDLDKATSNLDTTLVRFNDTITGINDLTTQLVSVVDRLDGIVSRVENIVGLGEAAVAPMAATESMLRNVIKSIRDRVPL